MKLITASLITGLLLTVSLASGCATSREERTIKFKVPPVQYEQHDPQFKP